VVGFAVVAGFEATADTPTPTNSYFACDPDHDLVNKGYKTTHLTDNGRLGWTDSTSPPEINHAHHPDELLRGDPDPPRRENE
jgi:hypothetical protein